jgi:Ca-activated chloride channel family protein
MNTRLKSPHLWLLVCFVIFLHTSVAAGQVTVNPTQLPLPLPTPQVSPWRAAVELHSIDAQVKGPVAGVTVKQVFRNDSMQTVEATYLFPLPADVAPASLQMRIDGQVVEGMLYDKDEARSIYEGIVRRQRDPALLEYIGQGLFQISVFPIPPGERRVVELTYEQTVGQENGLYRLEMPLRVAVPGISSPESIAVHVDLVDQPGLRTVYAPNFAVDVTRSSDKGAEVAFESSGDQIRSNFVLYFATHDSAIGANLLSYKPAGEDGYFVLLVTPSVNASDDEIVARDVVLVLDTSGSMQGEKIEQAREAVRYVVESLNPDDRFNLITFSTGVRLWKNRLQPFTSRTVQEANRWIDGISASGSTDINRALLEGLAQFDEESDHPAYLLFLTDGLPTQGETDPQRIIDNAVQNRPTESNLRLFTFGVGYDVNTDLLGELSQQMGGRTTYVKPTEEIDEAVSAFYNQIGKPVLANVSTTLGDDVVIDEIFPYPLPDLFAGEQMVITGRYRDGALVDVTIRGEVNGKETIFVYPGQELVDRGGESFAGRLWATRKIGALLEQVRRDGPSEELIETIKDLSLEYGIVTPYTSYLVVEPGEAEAAMPAAEVQVAAPMQRLDADISSRLRQLSEIAPSGSAAVAAAEERAQLVQASAVQEHSEIRFVEGKTFVRQGFVTGAGGETLELWVDGEYSEGMTVETVPFASERYFDLVQDERMARWLALSPEMIIVVDGAALRVTIAAE